MKKSHWIIVGILAVLLLTSTGIALAIFAGSGTEGGKDKTTFSICTDVEVFQTVPRMEGENISITEARDIGDNSYMLYGEHTTFAEYKSY